MRDARVVEVLANVEYKLDTKADFHEKANLEPVVAALKAAKVEAKLEHEEEHEAWKVEYLDPTKGDAHHRRRTWYCSRSIAGCAPSRGRWPNTISRRSP